MTPEQQKKRELKYVIQHAARSDTNGKTLPEGPGHCTTVHTVAGNMAVITQAGHANDHKERSEEQCDK